MFKLKPGNVFQKMNKMDKKQAYTWGAIVVVCFIALITLASFMGDADETSFEDFNTRGYDLAQMPFLNDEAEEYLLASKYPDMKGNNASMLYSSQEKKERQEEDAKNEGEITLGRMDMDSPSSSASSSGSSRSRRGYSGRGGGGAGAPTQVGQLGSASMGRSGGSGVNSTFGAPRGDFSQYRSQDKGSEGPAPQLKNNDARRALAQFAQASRAAAGYRDGKAANAKRASMGGNVQGSAAFTDGGIDLSKTGGLVLDTNAPVSSTDLSAVKDAVGKAAKDGKDAKDDFKDALEEDFWEQLMHSMLQGIADQLVSAAGNWLNGQIDLSQANREGNSVKNAKLDAGGDELWNKKWSEVTQDEWKQLEKMGFTQEMQNELIAEGGTVGDGWTKQKGLGNQKDFRKANRSYYENNTHTQLYQDAVEAGNNARDVFLGRSSRSSSNSSCHSDCASVCIGQGMDCMADCKKRC